MRAHYIVAASALFFALPSATAHAQYRPDLSGLWRYGNEQLQISENNNSLTIMRMVGTKGERDYWESHLTYAFDGSETLNQVVLPGGTNWIERSTARWVASTFEVAMTTISERGGGDSLMIYFLRDEDKLIRVEIGTSIAGPDFTAMVPVEFERASP